MTIAHPADKLRTAPLMGDTAASRAISLWLWFVAGLILAMVIVGGATRLTESGLSITEWQPLLGAIPPMNESDWLAAFEKYQQIPQYSHLNEGMSLAAFKTIYWWEWGHRFLGRLIGIAFALPLLFFWLTGRLTRQTGVKFLGILALGGVQGAIGWYMVKSGLSDRVDVSQYRLALHLTTALTILAIVVWLALDEWPSNPRVAGPQSTATIKRMAVLIVGLVAAQIVLGAFVAGLKAGLIYNTWPMMDGQWVPNDYWTNPAYLSFFESHATVQFNHRIMAYLVAVAVLTELWFVMRSPVYARVRTTAVLLACAVIAQISLGIATLLAHVPIDLALLHQGGGALVLVLSVVHLHATRRVGIAARQQS
jgi:cytochrome c oxidase assembly protein subunit 15